jgi:hypothetical protein
MSGYTVRKVKKFMGREGHGFNAELVRDGVPVAFVLNNADGDCHRFDWYDKSGRETIDVSDYPHEAQRLASVFPGEAALRGHILGRTMTILGEEHRLTPDMFVAELIDNHEFTLVMRRRCKKSTCYRLKGQKPGEYKAMAVVYSAETGAALRKRYGDELEKIYNEEV